MANPKRLRGGAVASFRYVGSSSSSPSPRWRPHGTLEPRPPIRSCRRRSQTLRRGSVEAQGISGSYECHGLRDAQALGSALPSCLFPKGWASHAGLVSPWILALSDYLHKASAAAWNLKKPAKMRRMGQMEEATLRTLAISLVV